MTSPLTAEQAAFITGPVSITLSSRDRRRVPSLMKAVGCRLDADGEEVTLLVVESAARQLLRDIAETGAVAAVFSLPSTHHTIQLKGSHARIGPSLPGDAEVVTQHREGFAVELIRLGYPRAFPVALHSVAADETLVAVTFRVDAIYAQTPGPGAGARLGGAA